MNKLNIGKIRTLPFDLPNGENEYSMMEYEGHLFYRILKTQNNKTEFLGFGIIADICPASVLNTIENFFETRDNPYVHLVEDTKDGGFHLDLVDVE